ncbi:hypothetical protein R83H12_02020 [Fibrobacteria bacterium R8-3-H12]
MNDKLLANVRHYFAQSVFNTTCHFKAYNRLQKKKNRVSIFIAVISTITLFTLILQIIGLEQKCQIVLNIVSFVGLLLTGTCLTFEWFNKDDYIQEMYYHRTYAEKYKSLRDEYMSLIEEIMSNSSSDEQLRNKKNTLQEKYSNIGELAPSTTNEDYKQAQIGLGLGENRREEFTWSDKEINRFLPEQLCV